MSTQPARPKPPSTSAPRHLLAWLLALGYGSMLAFVVFWPSPIDAPVAGLLDRVIEELHERGVPGFIDYGFIEFTANIALFIPVGIFFALALPMRWWAVMFLLGPVLSATIEVLQSVLLAARYATVYDVVANSIGATLGVAATLLVRVVIAMRDERVIERHLALTGAR